MSGKNRTASRVVLAGVLANAALFVLKIVAWCGTGSLGLFSDAVNSGGDVLLYSVLALVALWSGKRPDPEHPFGHGRAEPLGAVVAAIFIAVVALEILRSSLLGLLSGHDSRFTALSLVVLIISGGTKLVLGPWFLSQSRRTKSPILKSVSLDAFADAAASGVALGGLIFGGIWDSVAGGVVGLWVLLSSIGMIRENLSYLVGRAPGPKKVSEIRSACEGVAGVEGISTIQAHYVGQEIHVEIIIRVSRELSVAQAHDIGVRVQERAEATEGVSRAFVHIDA